MKLIWLNSLKFFMVVFCSLFAMQSSAQPGILDLTFGNNGIVRTDIDQMNDYGFAVAVQTDGKIVMAGFANVDSSNDFCLVRLQSNGNYDSTFGVNGIVTTDLQASSGDYLLSICLQPDGRILVGGRTHFGMSAHDFAIARYSYNGNIDSTFGTNGIVLTDFNGFNDYGSDMKIQSDGKIVMAGYSFDGTTTSMGFARYLQNGQLDSTFSADGKTTIQAPNLYLDGQSLCIQNDGKLIAVGTVKSPGNNYDHWITRLHSNGNLDSTFGVGGIVVQDISYTDYANAATLQHDGKLLVAGRSTDTILTTAGAAYSVARYNTNGSLDNSFGVNGKVVSKISNQADVAFSILETTNGKIILAGHSADGVSDFKLALVAYNQNGTMDSSFGSNGVSFTNMASGFEFAEDMALQSDGKLVVTGFYSDGGSVDMFVARYVGEAPLSLIENDTHQEFIIVPNPFHSNATIFFEEAVQYADLKLYDLSGRIVKSIHAISGNSVVLKQDDLPSGMYIVEIKTNNKIKRERVEIR